MAKSDGQACDMARGVPHSQPYGMLAVDQSFDMSRYAAQPSSDMTRGGYHSYDMSKAAHESYDASRNVGFDMPRAPYDMPRSIPQSFDMSRGVHQSFDMSRVANHHFDVPRGVNHSFEMQRGAHSYDMPRGPEGYDMSRSVQAYEMPRGTNQPYEMARGGAQPMEMGTGHGYGYGKEYQACQEAQPDSVPLKMSQHHATLDAQQAAEEVPLAMPKTAPQKSKSPSAKTGGSPFDFAKGYAQQLEMAKKAAQTAMRAKLEAKRAEKARQEVEEVEREQREAEEKKRETEERVRKATQPSEILKLYAQQLERMKKPSRPSEIAKMYARQLETARLASRKKERGSQAREKEASERVNGCHPDTLDTDVTSKASMRSASRIVEDMDTDFEGERDGGRGREVNREEDEGDPPPFEMAKYLAQLSKMMKKGRSPPPAPADEVEEDERGCSPSEDPVKTDGAPNVSKSTGLPFPLELMKSLGLPLGVGLAGVGASRTKRDRQELTIANKAKLIEQVESRGAKKKADIAREWGLRPSTLSTIMKNKDRILTQYKSQRYAAGRRRMRTAAYPDVEEALLTWFRYARAAKIPITGPILQGMGVTLAQELGHPEFSCSVGWLDRFKARHGLTFNPKNSQDAGPGSFNEPEDRLPSPTPASGAEEDSNPENTESWHPPAMPAFGTTTAWLSSTSVSTLDTSESSDQGNKWFPATDAKNLEDSSEALDDAARTWLQTTVPFLQKEYKPSDIFSAGEAALFYNLLPDKSLAMKREEGHKWTWVKERLTMMVAANVDGSERLPLHIIGQMKDPKGIYEIDALPMPYEANESAMMTSSIFENWVRQLDKQYRSQNRKIVIIVDACPAHSNVSNLTNVRILFFPQDMTSTLQPLDLGVIQRVKALYRRLVLERLLEYNLKGREYEITLLEAMELLQEAWENVEPSFVAYCFRRAGFEPPENQDEDTSAHWTEDEDALFERARRSGLGIPQELTFDSYLDVDSQVQTTVDESSEASGSNPSLTCPGEAMQALATLRKFVQERGGGDRFLGNLADLETWVTRHVVKPEVSFTSEET